MRKEGERRWASKRIGSCYRGRAPKIEAGKTDDVEEILNKRQTQTTRTRCTSQQKRTEAVMTTCVRFPSIKHQ